MTEVRCAKCGRITEVDDEDMWQGDLEDVADGHLTFRFTHYCEHEIEDDENWEECGHVIEVIRYAKLQDYRDIEQEE